MAERFSDMLLNRRRQLNLSIQQVANTIKIKPQIVEFFETGDFASMPPRGYAQGMIVSYARYLGLNPRAVVDAYHAELDEYERSTGSRPGRFHDAAADVVPHSSNAQGRFYMVESVPGSRFAQRPPQAGYVSGSGAPYGYTGGPNRLQQRPGLPSGDQRRPMDGRVAGRGSAASRGFSAQRGPRTQNDFDGSRYPSRDDLRSSNRPYRGSARPASRDAYRASSRPGSRDGYRGSRGPQRENRAMSYGERPYDRYRSGAERRGASGPGRQSSRGASQPQWLAFLMQDPRLLIGAIAAAVLLVAIIGFTLFSRFSSAMSQANGGAATTSEQKADTKDSGDDESLFDEDASTGTSSDASDTADAASTTQDASTDSSATDAAAQEPEETKIKVSIAKGKTSWVEIKVDGKMVVSEAPVGPWEQEFTPTQSFQITVNNPGDVVITKNGERVRYDSKSSGVGRITIAIPQKTTEDQTQDANAESSGQDNAATTDSATQDQSTQTQQ